MEVELFFFFDNDDRSVAEEGGYERDCSFLLPHSGQQHQRQRIKKDSQEAGFLPNLILTLHILPSPHIP